MNCDDIDRQMDAMLDGALDQQAERTIKAHLSFCPACQSKWEQLTGLRSLLQKVAASAPSESLESRVMSSFYKKHAPRTSVGSRWSLLSLLPGPARPVFAMILIAVMMAALAGSFILGRVTATQVVMINPPATPSIDGPGSQITRVPVEPGRIVGAALRSQVKALRSPSLRRIPARTKPQTANPIESFSSISEAGASYSTMAALRGFEPATGVTARVIKGEKKR